MYRRGQVQQRASVEGKLIMNYLIGRIRASSLDRCITVIKLKTSVQHARIPWMVCDILEWMQYRSETDGHWPVILSSLGYLDETYRIRMNYLI